MNRVGRHTRFAHRAVRRVVGIDGIRDEFDGAIGKKGVHSSLVSTRSGMHAFVA